jgi:tetratricopeptide (TPR) repeat protein
MKVIRRRALFYNRRRSNLYRMFGLVLVILIGGWFAVRLNSGVIRSPFAPTMTPTRSGQSLTLEGEEFFNAGDLGSAITAYQDAVRVDPQNADILARLARIQTYSSRLLTTDPERLSRLTEAKKSIDAAVALAPDDSTVHAMRAFVLDWLADPALDALRASGDKNAASLLLEAEQEARQAISLDSHNALALAFYAEILTDEQRWDQASQNIQQALGLDPGSMDVYRVYAYVLESVGDYNQAIVEYQNALKISPNLTFLYIAIGRNYRQLAFKSNIESEQKQLYDAALAAFTQAVTINQAHTNLDPIPYTEIAKTYSQTGDFFSAERNALKALSFDPTNPDLYGRLGIIYDKARNYESVIYAMQCAVSGCTPEISCQARFSASCQGNEGVTVDPLKLSPNTVVYFYTYGERLAALSPIHPDYCKAAVSVLNTVQASYGSDPTIATIVSDGLAICTSVATQQAQTPTAVLTPTLVPTPRFTPFLKTPATPVPYYTP